MLLGGGGQSGLNLYIVSLDGYITLVLMITALVLVDSGTRSGAYMVCLYGP